MFKSLIILGTLGATTAAPTTSFAVTANNHVLVSNHTMGANSNQGNYVSKSVGDSSSINWTKGANADDVNGLYIDSSKDTYDNSQSPYGSSDKVVSVNKIKRNRAYTHTLDNDFTYTVNGDKNNFLANNKQLLVSYDFQYNLWNSQKGWEFNGGKFSPFGNATVATVNLTGNDESTVVEDHYDSSHSNNEEARLYVNQNWNGNTLTVSLEYWGWVHWASGSQWNHAVVDKTTNSEYAFSNNSGTLKLGTAEETFSYSTNGSGDYTIDLDDLSNDLRKVANDNSKKDVVALLGSLADISDTVPVETSEGYGTITEMETLEAFPMSQFVFDAEKVMTGVQYKMDDLTKIIEGDESWFSYGNQTSNSVLTYAGQVPFTWFGTIIVNYIYFSN